MVHLVACVTSARLAHNHPMLGQRIPVGIDTQLLQQPCRALDVGEH